MAEKAGVAYLYLIICELCELCEQMSSVYFLRKVSMVSGKVARNGSIICIYLKMFVPLHAIIVS